MVGSGTVDAQHRSTAWQLHARNAIGRGLELRNVGGTLRTALCEAIEFLNTPSSLHSMLFHSELLIDATTYKFDMVGVAFNSKASLRTNVFN